MSFEHWTEHKSFTGPQFSNISKSTIVTHLFWKECFSFTFVFYLDFWFSIVIYDFKRPVLHVVLNIFVWELSPDHSFGIWNKNQAWLEVSGHGKILF